MSKEAAIGRSALYLGLDATEFQRGIKWVKGQIRANVSELQSLLGSGLSVGIGGLKAGLAGVGVAGVAGMAAFTAATYAAKEQIEELKKVSTGANAFGLGTAAGTGLFGLAGSAGSDVKDFTESLATMSQRANETGEVAASMFKGLGIDAKEFAQLRTDEQWYRVMDAISKVEQPAERVRLAFLAFGEDGGKTILSLVGKSEPELRKMAASFAITAGEMYRMNSASAAMGKVETAVGKLKNKLALAAAPFLETVSNSLSNINVDAVGTKLEKFYAIATDVFERVTAYANDQFNKISPEIDGLVDRLGKSVKPGTDPKNNPMVSEFARSVAEFGKSVGQFAGATADRVQAGFAAVGGVRDWLISKGSSVGTSLGFLDEGFGEQMRVGFKKSAKTLFAESNDAINSNTGDKWGKVGERLGLQAGNAAAAVIDKALTPTLKFNAVAMDYGLAALQGAESAMQSAVEKLPDVKASSSKTGTENTAFRAGTAEEIAFRLKAMNPKGEEVQKQQLAEARKQSAILKANTDAIRQWLNNMKPTAVAN